MKPGLSMVVFVFSFHFYVLLLVLGDDRSSHAPIQVAAAIFGFDRSPIKLMW